MATLFVAGALGFNANAQIDVTASYIGDISVLSGAGGHNCNNSHKESQGNGWHNDQTLITNGWHNFVAITNGVETWTSGAQPGSAGVMLGRTMVLPEGSYTLSFEAFGTSQNGEHPAVANDVVAFLTGYEDIDITSNGEFKNVTFNFDVTTANTAYEFGIKKTTDESYVNWCQIKNIKLTLNSNNITPIANNSIASFTYNGSQTWHTNTWSTEGQWDGSRFQVPFHELWTGKGGKLDDATITGSYTPTETGVYKVSAWVRAANESGGAVNGVSIFVGDAETDACVGSSVMNGNGRLGTYTAMADGTSGVPFNYGFKIENSAVNWLAFKNVTITYLGEMPQAEIDALLALVPTGKMGADVKNTLDGYVTAFKENASVANYNNLSLYLLTANVSVALYTSINEAVTNYANKAAALDATGRAAYDASAIQAKYDNGEYTTLAEAETELQVALASAVMVQKTIGSDWTGVIVNPSFENNFTGWTNEGDSWTQSNTSFSLKQGNLYAEHWQPNGTKRISQTIANMPAGVYELSVGTLARGVTSAKVFAGGVEKAITIEDAAKTQTLEFACDAGNITIGFEAVGTGAGGSWICADNFTLRLVSAGLPEVEAVTGKMNNAVANAQSSAIEVYNNNKTVENYNAAVNAINAASASVAAYANAKAYFDSAESILAGTNVYTEEAYNQYFATPLAKYNAGTLENAEASSFIKHSAGYRSDKTVDEILLSAWTIGGAQAHKFDTPLYINTWSNEGDTDGSEFFAPFFEYWVGDAELLAATDIQAKVTGLEPNATYSFTIRARVRATNNSEKIANAITMKVGEGEAVDISSGAQFGLFYVGEFSAFGQTDSEGTLTATITVAEGCNVSWLSFRDAEYEEVTAANMTITGAGWATFIAPFEVEIPEGVTAYTVAGVKANNYLNKTALETVIPANTPVLLEGAAMTETFYGLSTATQNTYGEVLVGNVSGKTMNVSAGSYVLLNQNDKLGFYQVKSDEDNVTVGNNRCYLNVPAGGEVKAFFFDDEATGINGVETLTDGTVESIFTISGTRVNSFQKGLNIVKMSNGKTQKVLVK